LKSTFRKAIARSIWSLDEVWATDFVQGGSAATAIGSNNFDEPSWECGRLDGAEFWRNDAS